MAKGDANELPLLPGEALMLLRENAARLAALTEGVRADRLRLAPEPGAWSAEEVLAHLRACCDVWGRNIARILAAEHPTFAGTNPRAWLKKTDYLQHPFEPGLRAFAAQRAELLPLLEALARGDWERSATVTAYGQANERTLRSYASQLAKHERLHVDQIERSLAGSR